MAMTWHQYVFSTTTTGQSGARDNLHQDTCESPLEFHGFVSH